jgi:hypothetical protein
MSNLEPGVVSVGSSELELQWQLADNSFKIDDTNLPTLIQPAFDLFSKLSELNPDEQGLSYKDGSFTLYDKSGWFGSGRSEILYYTIHSNEQAPGISKVSEKAADLAAGLSTLIRKIEKSHKIQDLNMDSLQECVTDLCTKFSSVNKTMQQQLRDKEQAANLAQIMERIRDRMSSLQELINQKNEQTKAQPSNNENEHSTLQEGRGLLLKQDENLAGAAQKDTQPTEQQNKVVVLSDSLQISSSSNSSQNKTLEKAPKTKPRANPDLRIQIYDKKLNHKATVALMPAVNGNHGEISQVERKQAAALFNRLSISDRRVLMNALNARAGVIIKNSKQRFAAIQVKRAGAFRNCGASLRPKSKNPKQVDLALDFIAEHTVQTEL